MSSTLMPNDLQPVAAAILTGGMARRFSGLDKSAIPHPGASVPLDAALEIDRSRVDPLVASRRDEIILIGE